MTRYVDDVLGGGIQHLVEWYGIYYGREYIGGEITVYCEVGLNTYPLVCAYNCSLYRQT